MNYVNNTVKLVFSTSDHVRTPTLHEASVPESLAASWGFTGLYDIAQINGRYFQAVLFRKGMVELEDVTDEVAA